MDFERPATRSFIASLPSPLLVVRRHPVTGAHGYSGGSAGVGADERTLLAEAGIKSYVKLDRMGSVALVVPEAQADAMHSHQAVWRCQACGFSFGSSREQYHESV